jgi:proliferating cell nuclear antigen
MLKFVIKQPLLRDIISALEAVVEDDIKLQIDESGFKVEAVDAANIAMVMLQAKSAAFDFYEATSSNLAMSLSSLANYTDKRDLPVSVELDEETHKLRISQGKTKYNMSLLDPNSIAKGPRIPALDMPCEVVISGSDLRDAITAMGKVSDHAAIEQNETSFVVSARGDIDSAKVEFALSELTGVRHGESRALFSIDYLVDVAKVLAKSNNVKVESGIDYPCRVSLNIGENIFVQYLLAPRIEQE